MSQLFPFRALRPAPETAARVASVPYDVVSTDEARLLASGNPVSFLHVTRPEIDLPAGTDPHADAVYAQAVRNFEELKRAAPLVLDEQPSLYLYRVRMGDHEQTGVAGCFSLDEYERGLIKKHELTRKDKEDDRTRHMVELRAQTGVVFLTYAAMPSIDRLAAQVSRRSALYDFTASDGVSHTIWIVEAGEVPQFLAAFAALPALYIADGHHRAASAARTREVVARGTQTSSDAARFLAVAFPDSQVQILPYNRVVRDLAGRSAEGLLEALRERMRVGRAADGTCAKGEVRMFLAGAWYSLTLPKPPAGSARADALDVAVLEREVLGAVLGIHDIRTDKRIDFVGGARGTAELERQVRSGDAAVAFSLHPVGIDDLMAIADQGGIMPPKSTWFEPKLRDGLLVHLI